MLGLSLTLYFFVNIVIAIVLWFAVLKDSKLSALGYFLAMLLLGLFIIGALLILFVIAILTGASYNLGGYIETKLNEAF